MIKCDVCNQKFNDELSYRCHLLFDHKIVTPTCHTDLEFKKTELYNIMIKDFRYHRERHDYYELYMIITIMKEIGYKNIPKIYDTINMRIIDGKRHFDRFEITYKELELSVKDKIRAERYRMEIKIRKKYMIKDQESESFYDKVNEAYLK